MMKLYFAPGTCALACWIALEWAGADYEVAKVDPGSDSYRRVNPLGMVPALDIGGARAMTQADAILHYIVERYPERDLGADAGVEAHFEFDEAMSFLTGDFHPAFWPFFRPERFTTSEDEASIEAVRAATRPRVDRVLTYLDGQIGGTGHVYRAKRTVADAYAFVMARWTQRFPKTWREYPNVAQFMRAMEADAAVARVLELSNR
jgi:glutathione S-transferase